MIESQKIQAKYEAKIPVIIEKSSKDLVLANLEQTKYASRYDNSVSRLLIPSDFTF